MKMIALPAHVMPHIHEGGLLGDNPWAVISITHIDGEWPEIVQTETCRGVLQLLFADIDEPWSDEKRLSDGSSLVLFNTDHAQLILDFVTQMRQNGLSLLIVHCLAGLSRSPAVAAALSEIFGQESDHFFRAYRPNMHVYRVLLRTYYGNDRSKFFGGGNEVS